MHHHISSMEIFFIILAIAGIIILLAAVVSHIRSQKAKAEANALLNDAIQRFSDENETLVKYRRRW